MEKPYEVKERGPKPAYIGTGKDTSVESKVTLGPNGNVIRIK